MPDQDLTATLGDLVRRHGLSSVLHGLAEVHPTISKAGKSPAAPRRSGVSKQSKLSAVSYVEKMTLPVDKAEVMMRAAERFESKAFLPSIGDVREFCRVHRVALGKSVSRGSAVPRVFTYLSAMDTARIAATLDGGAFSGPARLGPIADAIRDRGGGGAVPDRATLDKAKRA